MLRTSTRLELHRLHAPPLQRKASAVDLYHAVHGERAIDYYTRVEKNTQHNAAKTKTASPEAPCKAGLGRTVDDSAFTFPAGPGGLAGPGGAQIDGPPPLERSTCTEISSGQRGRLIDVALDHDNKFRWAQKRITPFFSYGYWEKGLQAPEAQARAWGGNGTFFKSDFEAALRQGDAMVDALDENTVMNCCDFASLCLVKAGLVAPEPIYEIFAELYAMSVPSCWLYAPLGAPYRRPLDGKQRAGDLVFFESADGRVAHVTLLTTEVAGGVVVGLGNNGNPRVSVIDISTEAEARGQKATYVPLDVAVRTLRGFVNRGHADGVSVHPGDLTLWKAFVVQFWALRCVKPLILA
jgi:hypothetical protein